jgi:glycosyltransferase involved in cell wall biosynthesis
MKKFIKQILRILGVKVLFYIKRNQRKVVSLKQKDTYKGNVLLSCAIEPFLLKKRESVSCASNRNWEYLQIARTFLDQGYQVDVVDYQNKLFVPQKHYSLFIGACTHFERFAQAINKDCIKIVHLDTAHCLFHNNALYKRSLDLQQRKGVTLKSVGQRIMWHDPNVLSRLKKLQPGVDQRIMWYNLAIEYADYATILGNQFTMSTYAYAKKPIYRIPISTCTMYPFPEDKNYETCRKNYLWLGSYGMVHKGLDLTLDAFADMPDYQLTICGPIQQEKDFERAYYKELYQTPNIRTVGWVDVNSSEFTEITKKCVGLIFPTCSEGQSGSVVNCLHAGLIPIVSYESGVDVNSEFGVILKECTIEEIKNSVKQISSLSPQELRQMSRNAWEFARSSHTRERFAEEYKRAITKIIEIHKT